MTKRKADSVAANDEPNAKKSATNADDSSTTAAVKAPKTLKEKILHVLSQEVSLVGLASLKKLLAEQFNIEATTANNNKLNKTLKALCEEKRDDFGKIGGSYHGGIHSPAFIAHDTERAAQQAILDEYEAHDGEVQCPHCMIYNDELATWKGEDSVARGSKFECTGCAKTFYTWISDYHTSRLGHKKEYKFSGQYYS